MRKEFATWMKKKSEDNQKTIFLTGDLGFNAFEDLAHGMQNRFINMGVAEQNMIGVAAGLAQQGLLPYCYSIAPFCIFRPAEQIRVDISLHNLNVNLIGNGGGYGYGIMGPTHHALEDIAFVSSLQNFKCFIPYCNEDLEFVANAMANFNGPSYLRLGAGTDPLYTAPTSFSATQKLSCGDAVTCVGLGPAVQNLLCANDQHIVKADIFVVREMPILELTEELSQSLKKTKKLILVEEHVSRGGLGENLSKFILQNKIHLDYFKHHCAIGYPDGLYGSQAYHQQLSKLDTASLYHSIGEAVIC